MLNSRINFSSHQDFRPQNDSSPIPRNHRNLTCRSPHCALRAKSPKYQFTFAKHPFPQRTRRRPRHFAPRNVLHIPASVANEMVMPHAFRIELRSSPFHRYFPYQSRLHQIPQVVINRRPRRPWIDAIHRLIDFRSRRVPVTVHQESHHRIPLRSAPQPASLQ